MRCVMTGIESSDVSDGIWDDGEWVSWEWINQQDYNQHLQAEYPEADLNLIHVLEDLVNSARTYQATTGRYLQIWGELGELYAEVRFGLKRHTPGTPGSDGRLGNDFVEVKTISPEKSNRTVEVKLAGNFNKLLIVKINKTFEFEHRMIDRKSLKKRKGSRARVSWKVEEN